MAPAPLAVPTAVLTAAEPLTASGFAPFGAVAANPRPDLHPSSALRAALPPGAVPANQGSALRYARPAGELRDAYAGAPSGTAGAPVVSVFACAARSLRRAPSGLLFDVGLLERHPFTSQTFVPLSADGAATRYLVVVAPDLPAPARGGHVPHSPLPDITALRAFVATGRQAVTYAAGTWHAPMVALGAPGAVVDFVVVQFANGVAAEDCEEVALTGPGGVVVSVAPEVLGTPLARL